MAGANLDTVGASQQTREHQRDAHLRLGACTFFVAWPVLALIKFANGWALHWVLVLAISIFIGIGVGYIAYRHGARISAKAKEQARAEREARKEKELADFMAAKTNGDMGQLDKGADT